MKIVDILTGGKEVLSDPKHWTQEHCAKDADGKPALFNAKNATCWCSVGAIAKAHGQNTGPKQYQCLGLLDRAAGALGYPDAIKLNDTANHGTVMQMFDLAIGLAREEVKDA
jgi:hypothetical protein